MVNFTINNEQYQFPSTWGEISLKDSIALHELCKSIPTYLKDKYDIILGSGSHEIAEEEITKWMEDIEVSEAVKEFPIFYGKVIKSLSNVPQELIDYTTIESRTQIFSTYLERFVLDIMYNGVTYQSVGISSFEFKGNEYYLPSERRMNDLVIPMEAMSTVQFCEASDFMAMINKQKEGFKYSAYIVAILCLMKDEKYDEEVIVKRAKEFEELPMDIIWEVFFCLESFLHTSKKDTLSSFHQKVLSVVKFPQDFKTHGEDLFWTSTLSQDMRFHWN